MAYAGRFGQSDDYRREELIRIIEHSVENLTLQDWLPTDGPLSQLGIPGGSTLIFEIELLGIS